jgi:hypothetical protein
MQCPFCYRENLYGAVQCQHCGAVFNGPDGRAVSADRAESDRGENSSGEGKGALVPDEVKGWNWGAFFLGVIWGVGNRTYLALLVLIPLLGFIMLFVLGMKGSEWAWRNKRWESVEHFKRVQKKWAWWGLAVQVLFFVLVIFAEYS